MNRIILASHGNLSAGARDTAEMILGELPNLYAISTRRDEEESIIEAAKRLLQSWPKEDAVYILTDILGGSVNNDMLSLLAEYPDITILCGMNMGLVVNLAATEEPLSEEDLAEQIEQSRNEIVNCSSLVKHAAATEEEDDL